MLKVGDAAPAIDAVGSDGKRFVLFEQPGLYTVVYFFPRAFTPGCTTETRDFVKSFADLHREGVSVVGVSTDDPKTQCRFAETLGVPFPILADAGRDICRAYDVLWPIVGLAQRVTYVVGRPTSGGTGRVVEAVFHHELRIGAHLAEVQRFVSRKREGFASRPPGK